MKIKIDKRKWRERGMQVLFLLCACVSVLAVAVILLFLLWRGIPAMGEVGVLKFLFGTEWSPSSGVYGILTMIVASVCITGGAMLFGVPLGLLCAVFLARFCPRGLYRFLKPAVELLAGIPSIVYGFFGLMVIVPVMQTLFGGSGQGMLTASILLAIMILPTIIAVTESSLRAVPDAYYAGSLALGATHERSVFAVVFPAAKSGTLAGVILGVGRAIGETMAVVMVAGNQTIFPSGINAGVRTLTANIVLEMAYAPEFHQNMLIATGVVLFVFILLINLSFSALRRKEGKT